MQMLSTASSTKMSGVDMDRAIALHLINVFKRDFKVDASTQSRATVRVYQAAERAKRMLSANPQCPVNIE
jgi:molecular chaperone DnaK (HSP70)